MSTRTTEVAPRAGGDRIAYLIDPGFPGGTSGAVAAELAAAAAVGRVEVHFVRTGLFGDGTPSPDIEDALADLGLRPVVGAASVSADLVVVHNPTFLRAPALTLPRIVARRLVAVTHENLYQPDDRPSFDVGLALDRLDRATVALDRVLAPVSPANRRTVETWLARDGRGGPWRLDDEDWPNLFDLPHLPPPARPRDRRGRLSRPGLEKFPALDTLDLCFPPHAEANVILGADALIEAGAGAARPHWTLIPFRGLDRDAFFEQVDVLIHFTAPTFRESYGRVLAEATAAGKLVVTDPDTARPFGPGVIATDPAGVDAAVTDALADPVTYARRVRAAQAAIATLTPDAFRARIAAALSPAGEVAA